MAANTSKIISTGVEVQDDVNSFTWHIKNYDQIQKESGLVEKQCFEFQTGRSSVAQAKWLFGMRPVTKVVQPNTLSQSMELYFKLVETFPVDSNVTIKIDLTLHKKQGPVQTSLNNNLKTGQEMCLQSLKLFQPESYLLQYLDDSQTLKYSFVVTTRQIISVIDAKQDRLFDLLPFNQKMILNLQQNYSSLLAEKESTDLKLVCSDGKEILAHRLILKAQCQVFASMLGSQGNFSESTSGIVNINDVSSKTMEILLHYFYTGEVLPIWSEPDTVLEFTYAAGKYQLIPVLEMLDEAIGAKNVEVCSIDLLNLVHSLGLKKAEARLMEKLVQITVAAREPTDLIRIYEKIN